MNTIRNKRVVIHWPRLGPYHIARLKATNQLLSLHSLKVAALEIHQTDDEYLWESAKLPSDIKRFTLYPLVSSADTNKISLLRKIWSLLDIVQPYAVAINGYSSWDSLSILLWCRMRNCFSILMTESKYDDTERRVTKEYLKKNLVSQFGAALCGGSSHRSYLQSLGMPADRIFDGYDAVDNLFFMEKASNARRNIGDFRNLPGLLDDRPFFLASGRFIPRKNFLGLIASYKIYKQMCRQQGQFAWRLVILGDGEQRKVLESVIEIGQLTSDITLAGKHKIDELPVYYGLAKVFVHPALQDQWGLVVNEAMASGLPVLVSSRAGCVTDLVQTGVNGFSFNPLDNFELAHLMFNLSFQESDLGQMGQESWNRISIWGCERFAKNLYQAIICGIKRTS